MHFAGQALWRDVGNPLSWPASLPFALWYRVHPRVYDRLVGEGFFRRRYNDLTLEPGSDRLDFAGPDEYFASGFSGATTAAPDRGRVLLGSGRVLLPLFDDTLGAVEVEAAPQADTTVRLRWNGRDLGFSVASPSSPRLRFELPSGAARVGINELRWEASAPVRLRWMHLVERR
jgi:hypothetical protein